MALFRPPWIANQGWPSSLADRVDVIRDLLSQHVENGYHGALVRAGRTASTVSAAIQ